MTKKHKKIWVGIEIGILIFSIMLFYFGFKEMDYNQAMIAILLLWFNNVIFAFENIKGRILFLFFNLAQFVFLMSRPVISIIRKDIWWFGWQEADQFAILSLFFSFLFLYVGAVLVEAMISYRKENEKKPKQGILRRYESRYIEYVQLVSLVFFVVTWICGILVDSEKVIFMQGKAYTEFYAGFESKLPYILTTLGAMKRYFLCVFLATRPKKKDSYIVLTMFVVSAVPSLLIGIRNPIVLNCIFVFLYFFIRDVLNDKEKWIGRIEKCLVILLMPVAIVFLEIYKYLRMGDKVVDHGIVELILDFFYNQGVSFDVLIMGHAAIDKLPQRPGRNYTFGGIIDYITHGSIAQKFFGAEALPSGNNLVNALERNSFAHNMSYITKGEEAYLKGEGYGSSYLLETYVDFGYIGLIIFSLLLGGILIYALVWLRKNFLNFTIVLVALTTVFFVPRAEALGWIEFLIYIQFWAPVIACIIGAVLLKKILQKTKICRKQN